MRDLNLEMAKKRENRPNLKSSRLIVSVAHESDDLHVRAHDAMLAVIGQFPTMIFLAAFSDGEPFDHKEKP